jgi:CRP/FNR family transcriptional regulator, anaerobic regulatory protein
MNVCQDIHSSDIPVLCRSCQARHHGVCGALEPQQLLALSRTSTRRKVESGAELVGELERYEDSYRLCYIRGPEGMIIELAERIG